MNYTTIENQIIAQSEKDTEYEIRNVIAPMERLMDNHHKAFATTITWQGSDHKVTLPFRGMVIPLIKQILSDEISDKRRKAALQNFLSKFNAVVSQIENLGIELEGWLRIYIILWKYEIHYHLHFR